MDDTIAAISTSAGYGGICIVRISGDEAFEIAQKIFSRPNGRHFSDMPVNSIHYGHIVNPSNEVLDEVLVSKMKSPYTYTGEDVVEINCHGGYTAGNSVLMLVLKMGARLAMPGEFTKNAFLNGRIDLSEAEAVSDMITSKTSLGAKIAVKQIDGALCEKINELKDELLSTIAQIEVFIQYPEYNSDSASSKELIEKLNISREIIKGLRNTYRKGDIIRNGFKTAIIGKPNVGKSMLLNCLTKKDKAIVTDVPGTTRDIVDETINLFGIPVLLMDTAGIRESNDEIESIGINRSIESIESSQLILFVIDASLPLTNEDYTLYEMIKDKKHIIVMNKSDKKANSSTVAFFEKSPFKAVISAKDNTGIDTLEKMIFEDASGDSDDEMYVSLAINQRHNELLIKADASLRDAITALEYGQTQDLAETDIRTAWQYLGSITGETADEDIIDEIFANFCLGK